MKYKVVISPKLVKFLSGVESIFSKKLRDRIRLLATEPRHNGSIKMAGYENTHRSRVGKYRIVYEIYDKKVLIVVVNIDHRKDIYR